MVDFTHAGQSGMISILQRRCIQFDSELSTIAHRLLCKSIACLPERFTLEGMEGKESLAFSQRPSTIYGIVIELPLKAKVGSSELVAGGDGVY